MLNERQIFYTEKGARIAKGSIQERLSATIESAQTERDKYASRASATGLALNVAIGLQVLLGSLTTGLSAVATRGGHSVSFNTTAFAISDQILTCLRFPVRCCDNYSRLAIY